MAKSALCIGINNYPGSHNDLSGCVNDVHDWTAALQARGFAVRQMTDKQCTKEAMLDAIRKLARDARNGDVLVLQYSGHGSYVPDDDTDEEPDGRDEVLCPCDVGANSFIRDDELYDVFTERPSGSRLIFLSDSCHSGSVSRFAPPVDVGAKAPKARFLPPAVFLREGEIPAVAGVRRGVVRGPSIHQGLLISGCQDTQTSADAWFNDRPNGAFTYYALKALNALPAGATYRQWFAGLRQFLPTMTYTQRPNLFGSTSQKGWQVFS